MAGDRDGQPATAAGAQWDRRLLRGVSAVGVFAAMAGAARVAQDAAIAWRYGTGAITDAYFFVLNVVSWPVAIALSTLTFVIAPAEASLRANDERGVERFRAGLLGLMLAASLAALPLMYVALRAIVALPAIGLEPAAAAAAGHAAHSLFAVTAFGLMAALLSAWLVSSARHAVTLIEALPAVVLVGVLVAAGPAPGSALFWGTTAGFASQVLVLGWWLHADGALPRPRAGLGSAGRAGGWRGGAAMLAGQVLFALVPLVDQLFAARMGDGAIAALGYSNRLLLGLLGLTGLAVQRASLPLLSELAATSLAAARAMAVRWAWGAAALGAVVAIAVAAFAEPLVRLLYERGQFGVADRELVASLLQYGLLQLPLYLAGIVAVTALAAAGAHGVLGIAAGVGLAAKVASNAALADSGLVGLQLATAVMYGLTTLLALGALRWRATNRAD
jgi:peptidoglycan biosynthesis protein MviN/MurJ (putative lipid II flippase)